MRPRHKTPQTFSLWMVDVLCCSLGAVIFLWLVKTDQERKSSALGAIKSEEVLSLEQLLEKSRKEKEDFSRLLAEVRKKLDAKEIDVKDLDIRLATLTEKKAALEQLLGQQLAELGALNDLLTILGKDKDTARVESAGRQKRVDELLRQLADLTANGSDLQKKLDALAKLNDSLRDEVKDRGMQGATKQKRIDELLAQLNKLDQSSKSVEALLTRRVKEMEELEKKLASLGKRNTSLEEEMKVQGTVKQRRIDELNKSLDEMTKKLLTAEAVARQLEKTAKLLPKLEEELKESKEKLTDEAARKKLLETDLAKRLQEMAKASKDLETLLLAKQTLEKKMDGLSKDLIKALALQDRADLSDKRLNEMKELLGKKDQDLQDAIKALARIQGDATRLRELMERRFAGLAVTGKKVVFLVDASGSMDLIDENTPSLEKWPGVRDTLAKIMNSMPNLEKFQVVTFSEEAGHPLGKEGQWLDFDPKKSPEQAREALAKIKPSGGTNLHKAFDAAFKMRKDGLDTIYILSDGLPSDGEGLTPEQDRATLKDPPARSILLTRHLRKRLKDEWNRAIPGQERVRINSLGFFYESPDVGAFLWALSREHDGSFVGMSKP